MGSKYCCLKIIQNSVIIICDSNRWIDYYNFLTNIIDFLKDLLNFSLKIIFFLIFVLSIEISNYLDKLLSARRSIVFYKKKKN